MPRTVSIGVCLLSALVLTVVIASPGVAREDVREQTMRASGATETFHIAPGGPAYTTAMPLYDDRLYAVEVSGTITETVYDPLNPHIVRDEYTLSAYHCLAARYQCHERRNGKRNYLVRDEIGADPSFPQEVPAFSPNGEYQFVTGGVASGDRLTFKPIPDGLYGPEGEYVTYSGEGFTFKITELDCNSDRPLIDPCPGDVKFKFRIRRGLPDKPGEEDLPETLRAITVASFQGLLVSYKDSPGVYGPTGYITLTTTHVRMPDTTIALEFPSEASSSGRYKEDGGLRRIDFSGEVGDMFTDDPTCDLDAYFNGAFAVKGEHANLRLKFYGGCLSNKPILWKTKHFKQASITVVK